MCAVQEKTSVSSETGSRKLPVAVMTAGCDIFFSSPSTKILIPFLLASSDTISYHSSG